MSFNAHHSDPVFDSALKFSSATMNYLPGTTFPGRLSRIFPFFFFLGILYNQYQQQDLKDHISKASQLAFPKCNVPSSDHTFPEKRKSLPETKKNKYSKNKV